MRKIYFYLAGLVLLAVSFLLDKSVAAFFAENRAGFLDIISVFIHNVEGYVLFGFVLIILIAYRRKRMILPLILTFVLYLGIVQILKVVVARPRPFNEFGFDSLGAEDVNRSFPSGHATAAAAIIRFFEFRNNLFYIWIGITVLVIFSRVYLGMHYLSDVIAGFVIGYGISDLSLFLTEKFKIYERFFPKHF